METSGEIGIRIMSGQFTGTIGDRVVTQMYETREAALAAAREVAMNEARGTKTSGGMARRWTAELIKARAQGMRIVCSIGPEGVQGVNVVYSPRSKTDPAPWRIVGDNRYRFSGRECHAVKYA